VQAIDYSRVMPTELVRQHLKLYEELLNVDKGRDPDIVHKPEEYVAHCRRTLCLAERGLLSWWQVRGFNLPQVEALGIGWDQQRQRYIFPWEAEDRLMGLLDLDPKTGRWLWWGSTTSPVLWRPDALSQGMSVFLCESVLDACTLTRLGFNATCLGKDPYAYDEAARMIAARSGEEPCFVLFTEPEPDSAHVLVDIVKALRLAGVAVQRITVPSQGLHSWVRLNQGLESLKNHISRANDLRLKTSEEDHPKNCPRFPIEKLLPEESNFLTLYYRWMRNSVSAPAEFIYYGGLVALSTVLGRRTAVEWGPKPTFPNLFVICIGESGRSFKSSAISGVSEILQPLGEKVASLPETDINNTYMLPTSTTPEAFIARLSRRNPCAWGVLLWPEFSVQVQTARREYMGGWFELLAQLYDSEGEFTKDTRQDTFVVQNPCINLMAGVQPRFFSEKLPSEMLYGGFLPRFVLLAPQWEHYSQEWNSSPQPRDRHMREYLRNFLRGLRDQWNRPEDDQPTHLLRFEEAALTRIGQIGTNLFHAPEVEGDEYLGSFYARIPTMLVKLCILLSIDLQPQSDTIPLSIVELAEPLVKHQQRLVRWVLKGRLEGDFQRIVAVAQKFIERCSEARVDRGRLLQRMRCTKRQADEVLEYLESTGYLKEAGKTVSER